MDDAELARVRRILHGLACRDRLSPEVASEGLRAYRIVMDPAAVRRELAGSTCGRCERLPAGPQPHQDEPGAVRPVIRRAALGGSLTGMVRHDG